MLESLGQVVMRVVLFAGARGWPMSQVWAAMLAASLLPLVWAMTRRSRATFSVVMIATVLFSRLPFFAWPELNVDESSQVAAARALLLDPVLYRSVDTETIGPVNIYPMAGMQVFGIKPTLASGRAYAAWLWALLAVAVYAAAREVYGEAVGRASGVMAIVFVQGLEFYDFASNPTELMSVALTMVAVCLVARASKVDVWTTRWSVRLGLVFGAMALSKLQAAPLGLVLFVAAGLLIAQKCERPWRQVSLLLLAGGAPVLLFGLWVATKGYGGDLLMSWWLRNTLLRGGFNMSMGRALAWAVRQPFDIADLRYLGLAVCLSMAAGGWLVRRREASAWWFGFALLMAGWAAAALPREGYTHHLLYLIPGALLLVVTAVAATMRGRASVAIIGLAGAMLVMRMKDPGHSCFYGEPSRVAVNVATAAAVKRVAMAHDRVALWGWCPAASVMSDVPLGTRFPQSAMQLGEQGQVAKWAVDAFSKDLSQQRPGLVVDCVGAGQFRFEDRKRDGWESREPVAREVRQHYVEVADIAGARVMERAR